MLAFAALSFPISCTKVISPDYNPDSAEKYAVKVRVVQPSTKAKVSYDHELDVHSLQVYAFLNGDLDVYGESHSDTLVLSCTQGKRTFYALINAPTMADITTEDQLKAKASDLSNSTLTSLEMIGSKEAEISKTNKSVQIEVSRLASRIVISKITKAFTSTALQNQSFKVKRMYLVNASSKAAYGAPATPLVWSNPKKFNDSLSDKLKAFMVDTLDKSITSETQYQYNQAHTYYCYPNGTATDSDADDDFTPRFTRLVIEAEIGSELCYYPINLPNLESNKSYNISEIKITKPGSTSPDEPVTTMNCVVTLVVKQWNDVSVTDGTTV